MRLGPLLTCGVLMGCGSGAAPADMGHASSINAASRVSVASATGVADGTSTVAVTVELRNSTGAPMVGVDIVLTSTGMLDTLTQPGVTDDKGNASGAIASSVAEVKTITAFAAGVELTTRPTITFQSGAVERIAFVTQPQNATAVTALPDVAVQFLDADGNRETPSTAAVTFQAMSGGNAVGMPATVAAMGGVATLSGFVLATPGTYTLTASATGVDTLASTSFVIAAGPPAQLAFTTQPRNTPGFSRMLRPVTVAILDAAGNATTDGSTVTLALGSGAQLSGTTSVAAVAGVATFDDLVMPDVADDATLVATSAVAAGSATSAKFAIDAITADGAAGHFVGGAMDYSRGGANDAPSAESLAQPHGIVFAGDKLFVSEADNNRIVIVPLDGSGHLASPPRATYVIGQASGLLTTNVGGTDAQSLQFPEGMCLDTTSNLLWVADLSNNRVLAFPVGTIGNAPTASYVLGQPDFTTAVPGAGSTGMFFPIDVTCDPSRHRLFVDDYQNSRILVFDTTPGTLASGEAASYVIGQSDFTSTGAATTQTRLARPRGSSLDATSGKLFVADTDNNRVLVFDTAALAANGPSATLVLGQSDFVSSGFGSGAAGFGPVSTVYDASNKMLFVGSISISGYDMTAPTNGESATLTFGGIGTVSATTTGSAVGLALDGNGGLWEADSNANRIAHFPSPTTGAALSEMMGHPGGASEPQLTTASEVNDAAPSPATFAAPSEVALDETAHRLYVADAANDRVVIYQLSDKDELDAVPTPLFVIGQPGKSVRVIPATQTAATLAGPSGVAVDVVNHLLYVADTGNARVLVYSTAITADAPSALVVLGQKDFSSNTAPALPTQRNAATFDHPMGLAVDPAGERLFVGDVYDARILVFYTRGMSTGDPAVRVLGEPDFNAVTYTSTSPQAAHLAYDGAHERLYATNGQNQVLVWDTTAITNGMPPIHRLGDGNDMTGSTPSTFEDTEGVALDGAGHLFVSDHINARVLVFDAANITDGEAAISILGWRSLTAYGFTPGVGAGAAGLPKPAGLVYSQANGRLFVSDSGYSRLTSYAFP
jgi:DNA-binding beta-propeller fold protein YncE